MRRHTAHDMRTGHRAHDEQDRKRPCDQVWPLGPDKRDSCLRHSAPRAACFAASSSSGGLCGALRLGAINAEVADGGIDGTLERLCRPLWKPAQLEPV